MLLTFNVQNQTIKRTDINHPVAGSKKYLRAAFSFPEEWCETKTAIFGHGGKYYPVILEDDECLVPWEVIATPFFTVSVFCGDLITANEVQVPLEASGYHEGQTPTDPTPDVYTQLVTLVEKIQKDLDDKKANKSGDTFSGTVTIKDVNPLLTLWYSGGMGKTILRKWLKETIIADQTAAGKTMALVLSAETGELSVEIGGKRYLVYSTYSKPTPEDIGAFSSEDGEALKRKAEYLEKSIGEIKNNAPSSSCLPEPTVEGAFLMVVDGKWSEKALSFAEEVGF